MQTIPWFFVKGSDYSEAAAQLTKVMVKVSTRANNSHLQLNTSPNVVFFFFWQIKEIKSQNLMFLFPGRNPNCKWKQISRHYAWPAMGKLWPGGWIRPIWLFNLARLNYVLDFYDYIPVFSLQCLHFPRCIYAWLLHVNCLISYEHFIYLLLTRPPSNFRTHCSPQFACATACYCLLDSKLTFKYHVKNASNILQI